MQLRKLIFTFSIFTSLSYGAMTCTKTVVSPERWHCTASDGSDTDAHTFKVFLAGGDDPHTIQSYSCGAVIEVEPSVISVKNSSNISFNFEIWPQVGCTGPSQKTEFIACTAADAGDCSHTMAAITNTLGFAISNGHAPYTGPDPTIDTTKMVVLKALRHYSNGGGVVLSTSGAANNYKFSGFLFTADYRWGSIDNNDFANQPMVRIGNEYAASFADKPKDIAFDKCMIIPEEEIVYGPSAGSNIQLNAFRTVSMLLAPDADGFSLTNSWLAGGGGSYEPSQNNIHVSPTSCSSAGLGTQCTGTSLSAAIGLSSVSCPNGATVSCINANAVQLVSFGGATGNWTPLNGIKSVYYVDANTIGIDSASVINKYIPKHLDSSTFGAFTGTLDGRLARQQFDGSYTFVTGGLSRSNFEGNYLQGIWTGFVGGGSWRTSYGNVLAGSDSTHIILGSITGTPPVVGQNISVPVPYSTPAQSVWCQQNAPNACFYGANKHRVGQVTAISGGTYTVVPYGPSGIDISPGTGTGCALYNDTVLVMATGYTCIAQWDGYQSIQDTSFLGNTFEFREDDVTYGKGCLELKTSKNFALDGNVFRGFPCQFFQDTVVQSFGGGGLNSGTTAVWGTADNTKFTHNIGGSPNSSYGADMQFSINGDYGEDTATKGKNSYIAQNIFPQQMTVSAGAIFLTQWSGTGGGHVHNTSTASPNNLGYWQWFGTGAACIPGRFYNDAYSNIPSTFSYKDNIAPFGVGPRGATISSWNMPSCWNNAPSAIHHNLFTADSGPVNSGVITDPTIIAGEFPTSFAALPANVGFVGTCTFANITNCGLAASSPYKGVASDGGDPGADLLEVFDHIYRWSRDAGLITLCLSCTGDQNSQWPLSSNWSISNTTTTPTFTIVNAIGSCSAHLYTDLAYINEHADTSGGNATCNRSGNTVVGQSVGFKFGNHAALTSNTKYRYKITDGTNVMVGSFTTSGTATAPTITDNTPLPSGTVAIAYNYQFHATGSATITWSATGLPGWASLSSSGALTGTPNVAATSTIHVTATNGTAPDDAKDFSLTINSVPLSGHTIMNGKFTIKGTGTIK